MPDPLRQEPRRSPRRSGGRAAGGVALLALAASALLGVWWLRDERVPGSVRAPAAGPADVGGPAVAAPAASAARAEPEEALPITQLPLRLVATVVRENRALSLATVEDLSRAQHQVLSEGQPFEGHPQAALLAIERGRVILDNDGVREQLLLDRSAVVAGIEPVELAPEQREYRRGVAQRIREITDAGEDYLDGGERTGLLAEGDISPVYEDGELVGVRVDDVRADGVYDRIGIRSGDVLRSINGVPLGSDMAAAEVLTQLASAPEFVFDLDHPDGTQAQIVVPTEQLTVLLQDLE